MDVIREQASLDSYIIVFRYFGGVVWHHQLYQQKDKSCHADDSVFRHHYIVRSFVAFTSSFHSGEYSLTCSGCYFHLYKCSLRHRTFNGGYRPDFHLRRTDYHRITHTNRWFGNHDDNEFLRYLLHGRDRSL